MTMSAEIPFPDDWHVHLRDDDMLEAVVGYTARRFRYSMVMPNLVPPITSVAAAVAYRDRILAAAPSDAPDFRPVMALYCSSAIDLDDLRSGIADGIVGAVKYYPAGATTNSAAGGAALADSMDLFAVLAETNTRLLVHAETTDPSVDIFGREAAFLDRELSPLCQRMPELLVTVEHVSTRAGVEFVDAHPRVVATITPHHLARERSDLLADGMRPDLYCKPVINSADDRAALIEAATRGASSFFLGTDSAPHPTTAKYGPQAKAGVFNAAYGLEVVADVFDRHDSLEQLAAFVAQNGARAYGVEVSSDRLALTRNAVDPDQATHLRTTAGHEVVLFGTAEASRWTVERL
ncbi:MAG: dihydroorotase [Acidimicrobiales bacterium]